MLVKPNPKLRRGEEAATGPSLRVWSFCSINLLAGLSPVRALWQGRDPSQIRRVSSVSGKASLGFFSSDNLLINSPPK